MGIKISAAFIFLALFALTSTFLAAKASDPDILTDFSVPSSIDLSSISRQYFTFTGFRNLRKTNLTGKTTAIISRATKKEFPALDGQGVSAAAFLYPPSGINPPHTHPRGSELLIVLEGTLEVGLVDSSNRLFVQTLRSPDMFIVPKGLVHYQVNPRSDRRARALAVFGSANAGAISLPGSIFGSGISPEILAKAFKTDDETMKRIVKANE